MKKIVLDTNVILFDALAVSKFLNSEIHIPFAVIEEIDRFKRDLGENGRNARHFSRHMDILRSKGSLAKGVEVEKTGSKVFVTTDMPDKGLPEGFDTNIADNRILGTALALKESSPDVEVELVTKDINLRLKADVFGIDAIKLLTVKTV